MPKLNRAQMADETDEQEQTVTVICSCCNGSVILTTPIDITTWEKTLRQFRKEHANCE